MRIKYFIPFAFSVICCVAVLSLFRTSEFSIFHYFVVPFALIGLGNLLNGIALNANNGKMPIFGKRLVYRNALRAEHEKIHCLLTGSSRYKCLCDIIDIRNKLFSAGDICSLLGRLIGFSIFLFSIFYF